MDVSMPNLNGLDATRQVRRLLPQTEVLILSQHDSAEMVRQAFYAGARGYVVKSSISRQLVAALEKVSRHEPFFDNGVAETPASSGPLGMRDILQRSVALEHALRESEELYRSTFENAPIGLAHVSPEGKWLRVNRQLCDILGYSQEELLDLTFHDITHPEDLTQSRAAAEDLLAGRSDQFSARKRCLRKDGLIVWVNLAVSCARDSDHKVKHFISIFDDMTERTDRGARLGPVSPGGAVISGDLTGPEGKGFKIASTLEESEKRLRAAFSQTYSVLLLLRPDGTVVEANRAALEGMGFTRDQVIGRKCWEPWWSALPNEAETLRTSVARAAQGEVVREECSYSTANGMVRFADRTLAPVRDDNGVVVLIVASGLDITEQKELLDKLEQRVLARTQELEQKNAELRKLSARLLQIQDEERRRIARELHDSVGQLLAAISMNTANISKEKRNLSASVASAVSENVKLVEQVSNEIRTLSHLLHPPLLDEIGLLSALKWYIDGFSERSKIRVTSDIPSDLGRLPRDVELSLFRIVQECLTNIHRHSGSLTAFVRLARSRQGVTLEVKDEGRGFSPNGESIVSGSEAAGVGLRGMRERVSQLGGQFEITSNSTGTLVFARLPLIEGFASAGHAPAELTSGRSQWKN
jgi:PAS domain S-box-containing protein